MSSTKSGVVSGVVSRVLFMRNLVLNPKLFFDDVAENGSILDALYFLLIISSFLSAAHVVSDETLTDAVITPTFLKMSMTFWSALILIDATCALMAGALAKACQKDVQVPKPQLRFHKTFVAGAFSFAPLFALGFHSVTISICALLATATLGSFALNRIHRLAMGKSVGVELASLGLVVGVLVGTLLTVERNLQKTNASKDLSSVPIGQKAPDLTLKIIGGDSITLKQATAQGVVVLDFWATWCPPCRVGLPMVSNAVSKFKDKGVKLYAVGGGEDPALEKSYLEAKHIDAVAATCSDQGFTAYKVDSIPRTIIIDKQGIVRAAHVGLLADEESQLSKEIESAL